MRIVFRVMTAALVQQIASSSPALMAPRPRSGQAQQAAPSSGSSKAVLDFEYFKTQVQPVFLIKRPGFTRCVVCHSGEGQAGFLQPLSPGATTWNEEQSRKNFTAVSRFVVPGQPMKSRMLTHPLEPKAGGDEFHNGGRQFTSQDDPQFQTIAAWVNGKTAGGTER